MDDPDAYLADVDERRRPDVRALDALIRETAPDLERVVRHGMLGYGPYRYRYASGREGESTLLALAAQKRHLALYVQCTTESGYLAERYVDRLPRASVGRSCVRFTALDRVDVEVLRELVAEAAARGPGPASGAVDPGHG